MLQRTVLGIFLAALAPAAPLVTGLDSIGLTVSDLDRSVDFYTRVLHFEKVREFEAAGDAYERRAGVFGVRLRSARLRLGGEFLDLTEYLAPEGRPAPVTHANDRWFQHVAIIVSDMDRAYTWLRRNKVRHASPGPQCLPDWNPNAGGIEAFYFRDPDGHFLEILHFPPDKGDPKWRRATDELFLGIDHTAIVVGDTEASLAFYRDTLGLRVAGSSENYGPEQERINHVFGARLRITSLRAQSGPGVEFPEYVAPRDGREYPAGERANDLIHWEARFSGPNAEAAARVLRKARTRMVSAGVVELPGQQAGFRKSILVRDPDGHTVEVAEP